MIGPGDVSDEFKWVLISVVYFVDVGLILLGAFWGGIRRWPTAQLWRFILLGGLMAYCVYGPIGAIRDGNAFSDRHWVLMNIGVAGIIILTWSAYNERVNQLVKRDREEGTHGRDHPGSGDEGRPEASLEGVHGDGPDGDRSVRDVLDR